MIKGAARVLVLTSPRERLKIAAGFGAFPINFKDGKPSKQIKRHVEDKCVDYRGASALVKKKISA